MPTQRTFNTSLLLLAAILAFGAFGAVACGGEDDPVPPETTAASVTEVETEGDGEVETEDEGEDTAPDEDTVTIAASLPAPEHGWLGALAQRAQQAADTHDDVEFTLWESPEDASDQIAQIEEIIETEPDAIVILPVDGEALTPVAEEAMAAGIPVVNVDREFTSPNASAATILGDNYSVGVQAATFFAKKLKCSGNVVEIQGLLGISVTEQRSAGFAETLEDLCGDGITIVAQRPANYDADTGFTVMESVLRANPEGEIDAVFTHDDDMAEGVVAAIENAGREDEMILTGVGGSQKAFDRIADGGLFRATYLYSPSMAGSGVNIARLLALGEGLPELLEPVVPSRIVLPALAVNGDNVRKPRIRAMSFAAGADASDYQQD